MPADNEKFFDHSHFSGQRSAFNREAPVPGKALLLYNGYIHHSVFNKIPGTALYLATAFGSSPINYLCSFLFRLIYQINTKLVFETAEGSQAEALVADGLSSDRFYSDEWRARLFLANGTDLKYFDGSNLRDLGLLPPGLGKVPRKNKDLFDMGTGAGSIAAGTYDYTFTYFDSTTQTESLPIGALIGDGGLFVSTEFDAGANPLGWIFYSVVVAGANSAVRIPLSISEQISLFGDKPSRADTLRIYRRDPGNNDFFLVTSLAFDPNTGKINSLYYDDTVATATMIQNELLDVQELIPPPTKAGALNAGAISGLTTGPKFLRFWRDSLFILGAEFPDFTITDSFKGVSATNIKSNSILYASDTELPDYYPFDWAIGRADGQKATGLAVAGDVLCIFKERSIYTMIGTDITNFIPRIKDSVRGCVAPKSIQEIPAGVIFLSHQGICFFDGVNPPSVLSKEIHDEIENINFTYSDKFCSNYDKKKGIYELHVCSGIASENNRMFMYTVDEGAWSVGRAYNARSLLYQDRSDGSFRKYIGKTVGGRILEYSDRSRVNDDGTAITAYFRSTEIDFDLKNRKKRLKWLTITAACADSFVVDVSIYADFVQEPTFEQDNVSSDSKFAKYAASQTDSEGAVYGSDRYASQQTIKRIRIPVQGVGRSFYVEIEERQNDATKNSFDLLSIELEAEELSK